MVQGCKDFWRVALLYLDQILNNYSTGQRDCSTYMRVKSVQYGGFTCKIHARNASKILHELLHAPQLHENCEYFGKGWNLCYSYMQSACISSQRKVQMPHQTTRSPSGLSGSKANYLRKQTAVTIISKVKHVILLEKTNKQTSFTQLNIFHEVLLKLMRPYAEQICCLRFEAKKWTNFESVRCWMQERENF